MTKSEWLGWGVASLIAVAVVLLTAPHPVVCLLLGYSMGTTGIHLAGRFA